MGLNIALSEMEGDWKFEVPSQAVLGVGGGEVPDLSDPGRWGAASPETARGGTRGGGRLTLQWPLREGLGTGFEGEEMGKGINGATLVWLCAWVPV